MDFNSLLTNTCSSEEKFCETCNSHFMNLRPLIKEVVVSKHIRRDMEDSEIEKIVKDVLDCSHLEFTELHKFEENLNGNNIFRARRRGVHIVYCIDKDMRIIFLRALKNYEEYKKFLDNKREIETMVEGLKTIR
jgi:mRNA-degrading endonuclease RelE of RelBE toxin-antitoxin system